MSVINRALRDLDARQALPARADAPSSHVEPRTGRRWPRKVPVAALVALGGVVAAGLGLTRPHPGPSHAEPPVASSSASAPSPATRAALAPIAVPARPVSTPPQPQGATSVLAQAPAPELRPTRVPTLTLARSLAFAPSSTAPLEPAAAQTAIEKKPVALSAEEDADQRYRKAVALVSKGRERLAIPLLGEALALIPGHVAARQLLATLLDESGQAREAETVLRAGTQIAPQHAWFALNLARLEAARGDEAAAIATLSAGIEQVRPDAEYRATLAALQLRQKHAAEAATQYVLALRQQPDQGAWWVGLALALEAQGKTDEAQKAYARAQGAGNLPARLAEFVQARIKR